MRLAELKAKLIILAELGVVDSSYQQLRDGSFTGYTHSYLYETANFSKLTTTAKLSVVLKLAEYDLARIETSKKDFFN